METLLHVLNEFVDTACFCVQLYVPNKVEIPERYIPDSDDESVTEEEKIKREEKAEKIKRLLTNSRSVSQASSVSSSLGVVIINVHALLSGSEHVIFGFFDFVIPVVLLLLQGRFHLRMILLRNFRTCKFYCRLTKLVLFLHSTLLHVLCTCTK